MLSSVHAHNVPYSRIKWPKSGIFPDLEGMLATLPTIRHPIKIRDDAPESSSMQCALRIAMRISVPRWHHEQMPEGMLCRTALVGMLCRTALVEGKGCW